MGIKLIADSVETRRTSITAFLLGSILLVSLSQVSIARLSPPGNVTFSSPNGLTTTAVFDSTGTWTLQFCSNDGSLIQCAQMTVTVNPSVAMPKISVGTGNAMAGASVDIPISLTAGSVGVTALQFDMALPMGVSFNTALAGIVSTNAGKSVAANMVGGSLRVLISGLNQNAIASGQVAILNLRLAGMAMGSLPLTLTNVVASDAGGTNVPMAASDAGSIFVTGNKAPVVTVGPNQTILFPGPANLTATATDDGKPNPPGALTNSWGAL